MLKKMFQRALLGFPLGITIGYTITIIASLIWGNSYYSPCVPELVSTVGTEIGAVTLQAVLCGLLGAGFAAASLIWENDSWSIVKQTGIYFFISALLMFPIAWFTHWMEHSLPGFLLYAGIFIAIFVAAWIIQYFMWKSKIEGLNKTMANRKEDL